MTPRRVVQRADKAALWEAYVAGKLARKGYYVVHSPMDLAEEVGRPIEDYLYNPDMTLHAHEPSYLSQPGSGIHVEVKTTRKMPLLQHNGLVFLCSEQSFTRKSGKLARPTNTYSEFFIVDKSDHQVYWVPSGTGVSVDMHTIGNDQFVAIFVSRYDIKKFSDFPPCSAMKRAY